MQFGFIGRAATLIRATLFDIPLFSGVDEEEGIGSVATITSLDMASLRQPNKILSTSNSSPAS